MVLTWVMVCRFCVISWQSSWVGGVFHNGFGGASKNNAVSALHPGTNETQVWRITYWPTNNHVGCADCCPTKYIY